MNLEYLNQNSGAFNVIFSFLVALATIVYAFLTWKLVSETRKMREVQTEPKISATIQPSEEWINFIDMIIQNIGLGPAYNINFKISPDFECQKGEFLSEKGFVKSGMKYLAPNQKFQFFLTSIVEDFEEKIKKFFEIEITYQNSVGKIYKDVYLIDFSHLVGLSQIGEPPLYKIAKNIEEIQKDINQLSKKVVVYTKKDVEEERKVMLERANKMRNMNKR